MAKDTNIACIAGRLVRDPEIKTTNAGKTVCNFSVAVNDGYTKSDGAKVDLVTFIDVQTWEGLARVVGEYCHKGSQVIVTGRIVQQTWESPEGQKRSKHIIAADSVQFIGAKKNYDEQQPASNGAGVFNDDDVPFM